MVVLLEQHAGSRGFYPSYNKKPNRQSKDLCVLMQRYHGRVIFPNMGMSFHHIPFTPTLPPPCSSCCQTNDLNGGSDSRFMAAVPGMKTSLLLPALYQDLGFEICFSSLPCLVYNMPLTSILKCGWVTCCLSSCNSHIVVGTTNRQTFLAVRSCMSYERDLLCYISVIFWC